MPASFLEKGKEKGIDGMNMPHICSDCTDEAGDALGDKRMKGFMKEVNMQMGKMGKKRLNSPGNGFLSVAQLLEVCFY